MTDSANTGVSRNVRTTDSAAGLSYNQFTFDYAASYAPAAFIIADRIQIGEVPAGEVLIPHLCRASIPILDTNGAPTGDYSIGTTATPALLKASAAAETAVVLFGEDWNVPAAAVGSATAATPIYLVGVAAVATVTAVGVITFQQVTRAWDQTIDG